MSLLVEVKGLCFNLLCFAVLRYFLLRSLFLLPYLYRIECL